MYNMNQTPDEQITGFLADTQRNEPWMIGMAEQDAEAWLEDITDGTTSLDLTDWLIARAEKAAEDQAWKAGT